MNCIDVIDTFSPRLSDFGNLCVAGGAVRDELMGRTPKDFDLFLLWLGDFKFKEIKEQLLPRLEGLSVKKPVVEWHKSEPYLVADLDVNGTDVQVMVNPAKSPMELIESFDWNVCLFAKDQAGVTQLEDIANIGPGKDLKLHAVRFPLSTLRRGFRFSERFHMRLRNEDVVSLSRQIITNFESKRDKGSTGANEPDMKSLAANTLIE